MTLARATKGPPSPPADSAEARRARRDEARARWKLNALTAKLKPGRPESADLQAWARELGAGHSETIYDESGRPIGIASVADGRELVDVEALIATICGLTGLAPARVRAEHVRHGEPYWSFKEAQG